VYCKIKCYPVFIKSEKLRRSQDEPIIQPRKIIMIPDKGTMETSGLNTWGV